MEYSSEEVRLRAEVEQLKLQVAQLTALVEKLTQEGKRQAAPFRRPEDQRKPKTEHKKAGRKPGHAPSNRKPPTDDEVTHTESARLQCCPDCGGELIDRSHHEHFSIDMPRVVAEWTRWKTESGYCKGCKTRKASQPNGLLGSGVGAACISLGPNLSVLASTLKTQAGMSWRKIRVLFREWYGLDVSHAGLIQAVKRVGASLAPTESAIQAKVRESKSVNVDETGWIVAGEGHWAWVAATCDVTLYVIAKSRGHEVAERILGTNYGGCLHSDYLNTYRPLACKKAKCISHLLAHMSKLNRRLEAESPDYETPVFLNDLGGILKDTIALWHQHLPLDSEEHKSGVKAVNERLDAWLILTPENPDFLRLKNRILRYREETFRCLTDVDAVPTNNLAERELRPLVIARKLSGCNRSQRGADLYARLQSVCTTLRRRGEDLVSSLLDALLGHRTNLLNST